MVSNTTMYSDHQYNINMTMKIDKSLGNSTEYNKSALGISLSTPILMMTTGVVGNLLALFVLYTSKREMKKTVFFPLLLGLAWTDLIGQLSTAPIAIIVYANNLVWVGGEELCTYHGFMMVWFGLLTPSIACCMSLERFIALRFSFFYNRVATRPMAQYAIVGCWITTCFMCTLPLMGFGSYEHQFPGTWCFLNFHRESSMDTAYASIFAVLNILFIGVMICCNVTVVMTLMKMRKNRKVKHSPCTERKFSVITKSLLEMEIETQMAWFLCAITIVFSICWLPLNVHIMMNQFTGKTDHAKDLISVRLASINQILDPWLYILLRKAMILKLLRRLKRYLFSRQKDVVTNKSTHHATQGNSINCHNIKIENPVYKCQSADWDSTANLVPKEVPDVVKLNEKLPKTPLIDSRDSETDVFLNFTNTGQNLDRTFHSYEEKTSSPSRPKIQRLNSSPAAGR